MAKANTPQAASPSMFAYIYGRYSAHSQKDTSIEQQFADIYNYCENNNIKIVGEYADRGISGKTDKRPEFQRLMRDCGKERVQLVICWKVDRFARNRYDSAMYKARLKRHNVRVVYAKESIPDGPEGILLESILEGSAEYYSANLAQNVKRGMIANAMECKVNSGNLPLGYRKGADGRFEIEPAGAGIARDIFSMYTGGMSVNEICADLNSRGCRTSRGAKFNKNSLRAMLRNERYIGVYEYADIRIEGGVPSIITPEVFKLAQDKIAMNAKAPSSSWSNCDYLLTGKLFCGHCGSAMIGVSGTSHTSRKHNYYACTAKMRQKTCKKKNVKKDRLEELVVRETASRVLTPPMINKIADAAVELQRQEREGGELPILKGQLSEVKKILANVMTAIEQGIITPTTKQRMGELEAQKSELEGSIENATVQLTNLTKEQIVFWLEQFRRGNAEEPEFRKKVIEIFVNAVYLYDDHIKIVYDYSRKGSDTVNLAFVESLESEAQGGEEGFVFDVSRPTKEN